jgi:hypothetical protein
VAGAAPEVPAEALAVHRTVVVAARRAEAAARRPTAAPMKLAAAELTAAPTEETVVRLPIPAGPFAESTFSPSHSSTQ